MHRFSSPLLSGAVAQTDNPQTSQPAPTRDQLRDQFRNDLQKQIRDQIKHDMQSVTDAQTADGSALKQAIEEAVANTTNNTGYVVIEHPGQPGMTITSYAKGPLPGTLAPDLRNALPRGAVDIAGILGFTLVFCVVGFPLARAIARWIDRRGATPPVAREVTTRLEGIEMAVESIAVEVERISEGQRFTARVLSERAPEPAHAFSIPEREPIPLSSMPANARRG